MEDRLKHFLKVREVTETLCQGLSEEDCLLSVTEDTSPPKWHLAHTTWFFENFILKRWVPGYQAVDPEYNFLFNSYYETLGTAYLPKKFRASMSRPPLKEVLQYRAKVTLKIKTLFESLTSAGSTELSDLMDIGINHEQQHQELLLMDVKRNFFANPLRPTYQQAVSPPPSSLRPLEKNWLSFEGQLSTLGVSHQANFFSYDNERDAHSVWLEPYSIAAGRVTNGEYREFIEMKGYQDPQYWLADGWQWVKNEKVEAPLYWQKERNDWQVMTLSGARPLDLNEPVSHVSYYEAQAFARFKRVRLPTEAEWEHAAKSFGKTSSSSGFLEAFDFHPRAREGIQDFHGGLWEWTQSAYLPYPRY